MQYSLGRYHGNIFACGKLACEIGKAQSIQTCDSKLHTLPVMSRSHYHLSASAASTGLVLAVLPQRVCVCVCVVTWLMVIIINWVFPRGRRHVAERGGLAASFAFSSIRWRSDRQSRGLGLIGEVFCVPMRQWNRIQEGWSMCLKSVLEAKTQQSG